jgi:hypothetical protein
MDDEYSGGLASEHLWTTHWADQTEDDGEVEETGLPWCMTDRLLWE